MPTALQEMHRAVTKLPVNDCELCNSDGGELVWRDGFCRVVLVEDPDYPGFCRVVLNDHTSEMTQLNSTDRDRLMRVAFDFDRSADDPLQVDISKQIIRLPVSISASTTTTIGATTRATEMMDITGTELA